MVTKVDKFGRVVLPKDIRDNLDLKPGQVLKVEKSDDEIILKLLQKESPLYIKGGVLVFFEALKQEILWKQLSCIARSV